MEVPRSAALGVTPRAARVVHQVRFNHHDVASYKPMAMLKSAYTPRSLP
jgi:hypothetical protein